MTERKNLSKFLKMLKENKPVKMPLYMYKDKDTYGGHRKPCDVWFVYEGRAVCVEFKNAGGKLSENQETELKAISAAGARCFVATFDGLFLTFEPITGRRSFVVPWKKMTPEGIQKLFDYLVH